MDLLSRLDLQLMPVKTLKEILKKNNLKIPRLKSEMVEVLLANNIGKDGLIHSVPIVDQKETVSVVPLASIEPLTLEFGGLPNEKIEEICEQLGDKELARLSQTSKREYEICKRILGNRKDVFYQMCKEIYTDASLMDHERRVRIYNLCILEFGSEELAKTRTGEPNRVRILSNGTIRKI